MLQSAGLEERKRKMSETGIDFIMDTMYLCAANSNDPNTHIGAVILQPDFNFSRCLFPADIKKRIVSVGCNLFPRGVNITPAMLERPEKYLWIIHAEVNAICTAARLGRSLRGCHLFTNGLPCSECAKVIVGSGIAAIYIDQDWDSLGDPGYQATWAEKHRVSKIMLEAAGIPIIPLPYDRRIPRFKRGQSF
ncbi:MAG: hypothetical protein WC668_02130 [Patescibacteria group bacterium]|jgi:dCMP deaminase